MADMEAWQAVWRPVIEAVGAALDDVEPDFGADVIEAGAVRRYLEPLEFDCALHNDPDVARRYGHPDVIAPYTALSTFALPPMRRPGEVLFASAEASAQPVRSVLKSSFPDYFPPFTASFATDLEIDFIRPARLGERLRRQNRRLLACEPKATRVGRGAFLTIGSQIANQAGEVLAILKNGSYLYTPHGEGQG